MRRIGMSISRFAVAWPNTTVVLAHNPLKSRWVGILPVQHNPLNAWGTRTGVQLKCHCSTDGVENGIGSRESYPPQAPA